MGDIKLFRRQGNGFQVLQPETATREKHLQQIIEKDMETFLGVRFLATEYATGKSHRGRIDSLGLDENYCPVIVEYKRQQKENVINQGLFYLDWLMDHQADFEKLVQQRLDYT